MSYATELLTSKLHFRNSNGSLKPNQKKRPTRPDTCGTRQPPPPVALGRLPCWVPRGTQDTGCICHSAPLQPPGNGPGAAPLSLCAPGFLGRNKPRKLFTVPRTPALTGDSSLARLHSAVCLSTSGFPPGEARIGVSTRNTRFKNKDHRQLERNRRNGIGIKPVSPGVCVE